MCSVPSPQRLLSPPAPYRRFVRIRAAGVVGVLLAIVGCDSALVTAPDSAPFQTAVASAAPAADLGYVPGWSGATGSELVPLLARERARIRQAQQRSQTQFEALKREVAFGVRRNARIDATFLSCAPARYEAETRVIGPEGGEIVVGGHRLSIPRGALTRPTVITAEVPVSTIASVQFSPHGLRFARPAVLTLDFNHCTAAGAVTAAYFDENHDVLEWPVTSVSGRRAAVQIQHFSRYGMATGRSE
jgi:hypothetical protein